MPEYPYSVLPPIEPVGGLSALSERDRANVAKYGGVDVPPGVPPASAVIASDAWGILEPHIPGTDAWKRNIKDRLAGFHYPSLGDSSEKLADWLAFAPAAFTVYHGTPHKFNKFDVSKVGTGQGAQSYGHGLYFAENPKVAGEYQQMLTGGMSVPKEALQEYFKPGRVVPSYGGGKDTVEAFVQDGFMGGWGVKVRGEDGMLRVHATSPSIKEVESVLKKEGKEHLLDPIKGATVKVDIKPSPDKFLDWDKPLSEQKSHISPIKDAFKKRGFDEGQIKSMFDRDITGQQAYTYIASMKGEKEASAMLNEVGIPGIRYLDQGSRGAIPHVPMSPEKMASITERIHALDKKLMPDAQRMYFESSPQAAKRPWSDLYDKLNHERETLAYQISQAKAPKGTYNYVVFSDKDVSILK